MTFRCIAMLSTFMLALVAATPAAAQSEADTQALLSHRLTLDNVNKVFAVDKDLLAIAKTNPELVKKASEVRPTGLDEAAKTMASFPEVAAVLKTHGLTSRDYLLTMITLTTTAMTHDMMASGKIPAGAPGLPTANLEFWKANVTTLKPAMDEWQKNRAELMKLAPKG